MMKRIPRLALLGLGFVVMLAVTFAMVPPESTQLASVVAAANPSRLRVLLYQAEVTRRGASAAEKFWYNIGRWTKCPRDLYAM